MTLNPPIIHMKKGAEMHEKKTLEKELHLQKGVACRGGASMD